MEGSGFVDQSSGWPLLRCFGVTDPFWNLSLSTVFSTWVVMALLFFSILFFRALLFKKDSVARFCLMEVIANFVDMVEHNLGAFHYQHFSFVASLFFFILICNSVGVLPFIIEPTVDLNTTLALGLIGLVYRDFFAIKEHGIGGYIKELFQPLFVMFPLHVLGKISSLISISFRLFGNIFAGSIIAHLWFEFANGSIVGMLINYMSGIGLLINLIFGLAEGVIQAFVFAMLSLTYLAIALAHEEGQKDHTSEELEKVVE